MDIRPDATLTTELTLRKDHLPFLRAAFAHAGWGLSEEVDGITTDDGYDAEVRVTAKITVPLDTISAAPEGTEERPSREEALERLLDQLRLFA